MNDTERTTLVTELSARIAADTAQLAKLREECPHNDQKDVGGSYAGFKLSTIKCMVCGLSLRSGQRPFGLAVTERP